MDHPSRPGSDERSSQPQAERQSFDDIIYRIGAALSAELNLDNLVQRLTDEATALCGAQFGSFFYNVTNAAGESYMLYTLSGTPRETFDKMGMPRNTALFEPTFAGTSTVRLADVTQDERYGNNAPHHGMPEGHLPVRSYLAVPVKSRVGEVLGGLFFGHPEAGVFTERDERVLLSIAVQAGIAIDNAHLYQKAVAAEHALKVSLASEQTARAEAERERSRIAALFMQAPAAIAIWRGPTHVFEFANPRYMQMMNRPSLVGRSLREVFPELAGQGIYELWDRVYTTGNPVLIDEYPTLFDRHGTGDKAEGFFTFNLHPTRDLDGNIDGLMAVAVDVTDQIALRRGERAARDALSDTEQRFRLAAEAAAVGIFDYAPEAGTLTWDARCRALFGLPPDAAVSYEVFLAGLHPDDRAHADEAVRRVLDPAGSGDFAIEYRTIGLGDGIERWIAARGRAFFDETKRPVRFLGTVLDITEAKRTERELRESEQRERAARRAAEALAADIAQQTRALEQRFKEMRAEHNRALERLAELESRR